jgi:hypothetical protein
MRNNWCLGEGLKRLEGSWMVDGDEFEVEWERLLWGLRVDEVEVEDWCSIVKLQRIFGSQWNEEGTVRGRSNSEGFCTWEEGASWVTPSTTVISWQWMELYTEGAIVFINEAGTKWIEGESFFEGPSLGPKRVPIVDAQ